MIYKWNYPTPTGEEQYAAGCLAEEAGITRTAALLLMQRGVKTAEEAQKFFHPQLRDLHDPFLMKDMDKAVARLNEAMGRKEKILIYGDYDVDGCTAVALVYRFIRKFYSNLDYYIPDRYDEGYGVSKRGVDLAKEKGVSLIIVLDCGIKAVEEISYAKELGIDFIICDHHVPDEVLPPAVAILNAKQVDDAYPYKDLSGCGVGFKFMQAFALSNDIPFSKLIPLLDLCVISIAADIVPVLGENRVLAYHGMKQLNANPSTGVKAIIELCDLLGKELHMNDIIFRLGPRINASGRMQNGSASVALLIETDAVKAREKAKLIDQYNNERKELDKRMTDEAHNLVESTPELKSASAIVISNDEWHMGVIGIVASRLTELYFKPAVVLTRSGDLLTGSARSIDGFDVYKALESCKDLLDNFGGHTYAAGLSIRAERLEEFRSRFTKYVEENNHQAEHTKPLLNVQAVLSFADICGKLHGEIRRMRPYGPDNERPLFVTHRVYDYGTSKVVGKEHEHIKLELIDSTAKRTMDGIAFGQSSEAHYIKTKHSFDIAYNIEDNSKKRGELQLVIKDIKPADEDDIQ